MNRCKKIRKEKGAITIYVILSVVFFAIFVIGAYVIANRKLQTQYEAIKQTSESYNKSSSDSSVTPEFLPIYNQEQLEAIDAKNSVYIYQNGASYNYTLNDNKYELKDNIVLNKSYENDYQSVANKIAKINSGVNNHIIEFTDGYMYFDNGWNFTGKFTAKDIKPANYGDYVNYGIDLNRDGNTSNDWRVFLNDGKNVYLIAADYVDYNWVPNSNNYSIRRNSDYKLSFNEVYLDYVGSRDIVNNPKLVPSLQKYYKWAYNHQNSTNTNIRAVAYMLDTEKWTAKLSNNTSKQYIDYAIGGPTIEMFADSYNKTHESINDKISYLEDGKSNSDNGYYIKKGTGEWERYFEGMQRNESNVNLQELYIKSDREKADNFWLASNNQYNNSNMLHVSYYGGMYGSDYYYQIPGFRPIICLKSGVKAQNSGNVWNLTGVIQ